MHFVNMSKTSILLATLVFLAIILQISGDTEDNEFDFIVVGAGTAGGIVAARLVETMAFRVLLLEAGTYPGRPYNVPLRLVPRVDEDWNYEIVPQLNSSHAFPNNSYLQYSGKVLGGTSQINGMIYHRGNPNDFNLWANITSDSRWNFTNVLPFFKKTEKYSGQFQSEFRGTHGPIHVEHAAYTPQLQGDWLDAGAELGLRVSDPNGEHQRSSVFPIATTTNRGMRWETFEAYIEPALRNERLVVVTDAHVTKIILNEENTATGVIYSTLTGLRNATARREVILSAGTIGSPKILLLSGIGDRDELAQHGITSLVHLPGVGKDLQDHVRTMIGPFLLNDTVSFLKQNLSLEDYREYVTLRTGPLAWTELSGGGLWSSEGNHDWPNLVLEQFPVIMGLSGVREGINEAYMQGIGEDQHMAWVTMWLGYPKSRGSVSLRSSDPMDKPVLDPKLLSHPDDMDTMVKGFKFVMELMENTTPYKKYNSTFTSNKFPGCEEFEARTDPYYECYLRQYSMTVWHLTSTCRMGRVSDPMAVTDSELRVIGVKNLRVIDASTMPSITNQNTNAPTMLIGELGSDLLIKEHQGHSSANYVMCGTKMLGIGLLVAVMQRIFYW